MRGVLIQEQNGICGDYAKDNDQWGCGLPLDAASAAVDHIIPASQGGNDGWANLQALHRQCNSRKGGHEKVSQGRV